MVALAIIASLLTTGATTGLAQIEYPAAEVVAPPTQIEPPRVEQLSILDAVAWALSENPAIRVVRYNPSIERQAITFEDAAFDWQFGINVRGGQEKRQLIDTLQAFGAPAVQQRRDFLESPTDNQVSLGRLGRHGGNFEFGYSTNYQRFEALGPFNVVNPAWDSILSLRIDQPLVQGRRREVNEERIRIAFAGYKQQKQIVRAELNRVAFDTAVAYWDAVFLQRQSAIIADAVEAAKKRLDTEQSRLKLGTGSLPQVTAASEQYFRFLSQQRDSDVQAATARVFLAQSLGINEFSIFSLVSDPRDASDPEAFDVELAIARAGANPLLLAQRQVVNAEHAALIEAQDGLRPDIRAEAFYATRGLDDRIGGSLDTLYDFEFRDWYVGLSYNVPIGRRAAHAETRAAQLRMSRARAELTNIRNDIAAQIGEAHARLIATASLQQLAKQRVEVTVENVEALTELYEAGRIDLETIVNNDARLLDARLAEISVATEYEKALAQWAFAQGTLWSEYTEVVVDSTASSTTIHESLK